jgi:hypothetical protein
LEIAGSGFIAPTSNEKHLMREKLEQRVMPAINAAWASFVLENKNQRVAAAQPFQEASRNQQIRLEHRAPNRAKILQVHLQAARAAKMVVEFARGHGAAFVNDAPFRVQEKRGGTRPVAACRRQLAQHGVQLEINQNFPTSKRSASIA